MIDTATFRLPIRRCRRCGSWLGIIAANRHECHRDDPIVDAILSEYARMVGATSETPDD